MIAFAGIALLLFKAVTCEDVFQEGQQHGGNGGYESTIVCPFGGAFTAVNFRAKDRIDSVEFECTSSKGITKFGPYGGSGGTPKRIACPPGQYINYFYGKSAARVDRLGFYCRPQTGIKVKNDGTDAGWAGGNGGKDFSDKALSVGYRIVKIKVRSANELDSIQVTYGTTKITGKLCTGCKNYQEKWAPKHGGNGGRLTTVYCPAEGVITGIKYRAADRLDSITFICTSPVGISELGPFGGKGGTAGEENCPPGSYISSIHGQSAEKVDSLGIRCRKVGQTSSSARRDTHGGLGGQSFDDVSFEANSYRPVQIRIRHAEEVDMIQLKYGNMPVAMKCKVSQIVVTDKNIIAKDDGFEVIGIATGSTCSKQTQTLTISKTDTVEETTGVETSDEFEVNWATQVAIGFSFAVGIGATSTVSTELSQSVGGSKTWSSTTSKSTSTSSASTVGASINYQGPGASVAIGVMKRYKITRDKVPVLYNFKCDAGTLNPQAGTIKLTSTTFNQASFYDYYHAFKKPADCSAKARQCVAGLKPTKIISNPKDIQNQFNKCFQ